ncbi:CS domain containing protein [Novymonas esmeraldas]|uniref:CS domain containing protein n=1 Tax=Novymonas esmeraldas TaxID=1808958 RepID=A0AAW0ERK4_9TRYP
MAGDGVLLPPIAWAQRPELLLLTIPLQDTTDVALEIAEEGRELRFSCSAAGGQRYAVVLPFYGVIASEESQHVVRPRQIELKLRKRFRGSLEDAEEDEVEWPRLTKTKAKHPNITVDWSRWRDEGDADDDAPADDLGDFGLGGGRGDALDEQHSAFLRQLAESTRTSTDGSAGGSAGGLPGAHGTAAAQAEDDDDMPPLEEDDG